MEKPTLIKDLGMMYARPVSTKKLRYGLFKCECGKTFKRSFASIKAGNTQSCGCYRKKHPSGFKHGLINTRLYSIWREIKRRCYNKNEEAYVNYGARGITVCDKWKDDFKSFYDWAILNEYSDDLQIDRRENDGNYEPTNCRFVKNYVNHQKYKTHL